MLIIFELKADGWLLIAKRNGGDKMRFKIFKKISLTVLLLLIIFFNTASAEEKKYPPYPDVWGYELSTNHPHIDEVAKMPDGDYMITYTRERKEQKGKAVGIYTYAWVLFFAGISKDFEKDELGKFLKRIKEEKREVKLYPPPPVIFSDGSIIKITGGFGNCADPILSTYLQKKDKVGKVIAQKILLYLYDEPVKESINTTCERNWDYKKDDYFEKVGNMRGKFIPLEDDTFLILASSPKSVVIIRFDKDFNTKSELLGKNIFLLDYNKTFGKLANKYGSDDQAVNDALSEHLTNLKKGGK